MDLNRLKAAINKYGEDKIALDPHGGHHQPARRVAVLAAEPAYVKAKAAATAFPWSTTAA